MDANCTSPEEWKSKISSRSYSELKALASIEPVGSDALVYQTARVAQAFGGGEFKKWLILSMNRQQTPEQIKALAEMFKRGNNRKPGH